MAAGNGNSEHHTGSAESFKKVPVKKKTFDVNVTFQVVTGKIPENLLEKLSRDFTQDEVEHIFARIHRTIAASVQEPAKPAVLWLFGPSAVGKSSVTDASATQLFGSPQNAVMVDGEYFREQHVGWRGVVLHGMQNHLLHKDAWTVFKNVKASNAVMTELDTEAADQLNERTAVKPIGISTRLKQRVMTGALKDRQNLIIPNCANQLDRLEDEMQDLIRAGYEMHAVCMWAPLSETRARGEPRSVREGKAFSSAEYDLSTKSTVALAERWRKEQKDKNSPFKTLALWDNTVFPAREIQFDEFSFLSALTEQQATDHAWRTKVPRSRSTWQNVRQAASSVTDMLHRHIDAETQTTPRGDDGLAIDINDVAPIVIGSHHPGRPDPGRPASDRRSSDRLQSGSTMRQSGSSLTRVDVGGIAWNKTMLAQRVRGRVEGMLSGLVVVGVLAAVVIAVMLSVGRTGC